MKISVKTSVRTSVKASVKASVSVCLLAHTKRGSKSSFVGS